MARVALVHLHRTAVVSWEKAEAWTCLQFLHIRGVMLLSIVMAASAEKENGNDPEEAPLEAFPDEFHFN